MRLAILPLLFLAFPALAADVVRELSYSDDGSLQVESQKFRRADVVSGTEYLREITLTRHRAYGARDCHLRYRGKFIHDDVKVVVTVGNVSVTVPLHYQRARMGAPEFYEARLG